MLVKQPFEAFYLPSQPGRAFCTYFKPEVDQKQLYLFLPSVAEDMNRCRAMVAAQARHLASCGIGVILLDYFGTGDSEGDFSETSWDVWKQNALDLCDWAEARSLKVTGLWGVRFGAMLAAELAHEHKERFSKLLFWQPVISGQSYMTQILRMRMAGQMDRSEPIEKTDSIRARMRAGESVEIGGYLYSGELGCELDSKNLADYELQHLRSVDWFEILRSQESDFPRTSQNVHEMWLNRGVSLKAKGFLGAAFWQIQERVLAPELIKLTTQAMQR